MPIIDIDGLRVTCEYAGTGFPIVFIPGLVGTTEWFRYQFSGLWERYRVISYDVRAAGGVSGYNLDLLTEDLARLLSALRIESAAIVGHSFGGAIAQQFARTHRDRVDALILISSFPHLPQAPRETLIEWLAPGEVRVESNFDGFLRRLFRLKEPAPPEDVEGIRWLAAHTPRVSRPTLSARLDLIQRFNSSSWLSEIEAPTLVIVGARDSGPFLGGAQMLHEGIPDSSLEVVENGDHFCFFTRHDGTNSAIDEFLTERIASL